MGIELTDREKYVVALREKEGKTFAEIAREEKVGVERARQIYLKAKRKERRVVLSNYELDDLILEKTGDQRMAMRISNALLRNDIKSLEDLMNTPDEVISRIRNIGPQSAKLLSEIKNTNKQA